jgi:hypothetical protein
MEFIFSHLHSKWKGLITVQQAWSQAEGVKANHSLPQPMEQSGGHVPPSPSQTRGSNSSDRGVCYRYKENGYCDRTRCDFDHVKDGIMVINPPKSAKESDLLEKHDHWSFCPLQGLCQRHSCCSALAPLGSLDAGLSTTDSAKPPGDATNAKPNENHTKN